MKHSSKFNKNLFAYNSINDFGAKHDLKNQLTCRAWKKMISINIMKYICDKYTLMKIPIPFHLDQTNAKQPYN